MRINELKLPVHHTKEELDRAVANALHKKHAPAYRVVRVSLDARKKPDIKKIYSVETGPKERAYHMPVYAGGHTAADRLKYRPVIVGAGPAGLFCALLLAEQGYRPLVLERGRDAAARAEDVKCFWETGKLDPESNVQFGEGGAGTFSDGKLNTGVSDKYGRKEYVLEAFVEAGAPEDILYKAHPHIGTDYLVQVVSNLRKRIVSLGGEVRFETKVTGFDPGQRILYCTEETIPYEVCVLAIGHSARDTFEALYKTGIPMEAKPFAVGVRAEHPQRFINLCQYGLEEDPCLWPAEYKLTANLANGRSVYSFCMCPGGTVVDASSEPGHLCVNGMSEHARDGETANAAIVVSVTQEDYAAYGEGPLAGMAYQRALERKAFLLNRGRIPEETFGSFKQAPEKEAAEAPRRLREIFPAVIGESIVEAMSVFGRKMHGYDADTVLFKGVESRTSSPVRIVRDADLTTAGGIYPCGEGAGYAGGIMSAAMDGMKVAEAIIRTYSGTDPEAGKPSF